MEESGSPEKKKFKSSDSKNSSKREIEDRNESTTLIKRIKSEGAQEDLQALKRKNFVVACEQVSYNAYFDLRTRLQIIYLPPCVNGNPCKHHDYKTGTNIKEVPSYAEESFKIEMKTNMWCEALEVCQLCISPVQYLSANILKDIVEILMNAHEDAYADYTIDYLLYKCQQILSQNFSTHPPCMIKSLRKCYNNFLTSPLDLRENTFTNRKLFGCDKGIVKYCMNRLEYELSVESKDEALVDKYENIPEEMQQSVKGLHWQKEKFEIFELLYRPERIQRLMLVLQSIIELLQFDLAIWHTRYTSNLGSHIMRSHKPLMANILWSNNVLYTGAVNNNCRQILKLFVQFVHLKYPEEHIIILTAWLNTIIQTFYICESSSNSDYPNTGKYCMAFAKEFYKIFSEMPHDTIIRILERIQPTYMQSLVGSLHLKNLLSIQDNDIIKIFIDIIKKSDWQRFPVATTKLEIPKKIVIKPRKIKNVTKYLTNKFNDVLMQELEDTDIVFYPKFDPSQIENTEEINQNDFIHIIYVTLEAYLDAYSVQLVQERLDNLNEQLFLKNNVEDTLPTFSSYSVTEHFIKKYRSIFQMLKELMCKLLEMKNSGKLPDVLTIFEKIGLLWL